MKAGRELDARIAEEVMGLKTFEQKDYIYGMRLYYQGKFVKEVVPHYSTQIADAWLVVEKILSNNYIDIEYVGYDGWRVMFYYIDEAWTATAPTAPLAICLAALKAVE